MNQSQTINISTSTILRVVLILLALIFLYLIRDILMVVFVAVIIAAAINGPVSWLQRHKVPRLLGVIFVYLLLFLLLALIVTLVFPPLAEQIKQLAVHFPEFMEKIGLSVQEWWSKYRIEGGLQTLLDRLSSKLTQATSSVFATIIGLFGGLISAIIILVISFYLAVQEKGAKRFLVSLTPSEHQLYLSGLIERIESKIGGWLRGQLLLMLIVGLLTYIGLYLLGVKYALTLALIAALLEIIPYIGPILAAVPAVILSFFQSPFLALLVVILYIVIQQLENYVLVPQVMKRAVGLNPVIIIIVMLIGAKLAGILGIILAVPLAAAVTEFLKDFQKREA
jgi:predicted PurR-regulated permease PerM